MPIRAFTYPDQVCPDAPLAELIASFVSGGDAHQCKPPTGMESSFIWSAKAFDCLTGASVGNQIGNDPGGQQEVEEGVFKTVAGFQLVIGDVSPYLFTTTPASDFELLEDALLSASPGAVLPAELSSLNSLYVPAVAASRMTVNYVAWSPSEGGSQAAPAVEILGATGPFRADGGFWFEDTITFVEDGHVVPVNIECAYDGDSLTTGAVGAPRYLTVAPDSTVLDGMLAGMAPFAWFAENWVGNPFRLMSYVNTSYGIQDLGGGNILVTEELTSESSHPVFGGKREIVLFGQRPVSATLKNSSGEITQVVDYVSYAEFGDGMIRPDLIRRRIVSPVDRAILWEEEFSVNGAVPHWEESARTQIPSGSFFSKEILLVTQ